MELRDYDKVRKVCEEMIKACPYEDDVYDCGGGGWHSNLCGSRMNRGTRCLRVEVEETEKRLKNLGAPSLLKDCARDLAKANGLHTLEGWVQDSGIYLLEYVLNPIHTCVFRGVESADVLLSQGEQRGFLTDPGPYIEGSLESRMYLRTAAIG